MSDSAQPHRWQPTRLPHPWDSPGKNTGVGCHFLLQRMKVKSESEVAQSCPTLRDPMDCSLPGSSVHGIFQARVLEWVASFFCGKESLRRNGVVITVNKIVQKAVLGCNLKNNRMICLFSRQIIQCHSNPNRCPKQNAEEAEVEQFCEDLQDLLN